MPENPAPALKDMFNAARFRQLAALLAGCHPGFDSPRFIALATTGLEPLSLLQRLRHGTHALHATLPPNYPAALAVLRRLAPQIGPGFVGLMLPDYVGLYGREHLDESLAALHFFTRFSSGEFAIREFLQRDLAGTLAVMERWSHDPDEHVRRLASEGCRPRLPWSFRLTALVADPTPALPILHNLRADPSLYVRKSVANHLNDIAKDHPERLLALLAGWDRTDPRTAWIVKRALRTLIKRGDPRALALIGATGHAAVAVENFRLTPQRLRLGGTVEFSCTLRSTARREQRLVADYAVHYVKKSGKTAPKVFKLRELALTPGASATLAGRVRLRQLSTRRHHPGRHRVVLLLNGRPAATAAFNLLAPA